MKLQSELVSSVSAPRGDVITVTRRWILTVQTVTLHWDAARTLLRASRAAYWIYHLTQSVTFVSGVLLLSLSLSFATNLQNESEKRKKKACCSLSADASTLTTVCRKPQRFPYSCRRVIVRNFSSKTWSLLFYVFKAQKKKQTQVFLLICSVWQIGEFICTLKWHRVCSTEPDSHPPMTSAFFIFFLKTSFCVPSKDRITSICLFHSCLLFARRL